MVVAVSWRSMAVMVPSTGIMGSWSLPLVPYGGCGGDDDIEEPGMEERDMASLWQGLVGSSEE
jgi:hypothetical protein